jgi:hypothetical protein
MNYQKIYNQLIEKRKIDILSKKGKIYCERHHIIPKCLGGSDDKSNIVNLTAREHFLSHWLLHRIYPNNSSLALAFFRCSNKNHCDRGKFTPSSRAYGEARIAFSIANSKNKKGLINSKEQNEKISIWQKNNKKECPHCFILINPVNYFLYHGDLCKKNLLITKEQVEIRRNNPKTSCKKVIQLNMDGDFIKEWESLIQVKNELNIQIGSACLGKAKQAGGFKWKYEKDYDKQFIL